MIHKLIAHAGEDHSNTAEAAEHVFNLGLIAIPIYIGLILGLFLLGGKLNISPPTRILLALAISFAAGVLGYVLVPALSVIALTFGIGLALVFTLASLA